LIEISNEVEEKFSQDSKRSGWKYTGPSKINDTISNIFLHAHSATLKRYRKQKNLYRLFLVEGLD
jgi:hypothetical protein